jgi:hypothetical protein
VGTILDQVLLISQSNFGLSDSIPWELDGTKIINPSKTRDHYELLGSLVKRREIQHANGSGTKMKRHISTQNLKTLSI